LSEAARNKSPEHRASFEAAARAKAAAGVSEETRAKMSAAHKGRPKSPEHRAKIGAAHKGVPRSPESRAKQSESMLAVWAVREDRSLNPEHRAAFFAGSQRACIRRQADNVEFAYGVRILNDSWYQDAPA
jgi:hypothetical protein